MIIIERTLKCIHKKKMYTQSQREESNLKKLNFKASYDSQTKSYLYLSVHRILQL